MSESIKILCVEDNPGDARLIKELFAECDTQHYFISFASDLAAAKKSLEDFVFDLILLDLTLPDSSGLETLKRIKTLSTETPIIVLTGLNDEAIAEKSLQLGAQDYIVKNYITSSLLGHSAKYAVDRHAFSSKLEASQLQFKNLIEKNVDGILVIDAEGMIKYANPASENLFLQSKDELFNQSFGFPFSLDAGTEIDLLGPNGTTKNVEMRISEIIWEDEPCFLASLRDVSARKELEEKNLEYSSKLKQLNDDKDKFFSIIAHDLKSPFSSFLGLTELLVEELPDMDQSEILKMANAMQKSALNLFGLIENLLEWAQIQRGLIPMHPKNAQLKGLLLDGIEILNDFILNKKIKFELDIPEEINVFVDPHMFKTIVRNFVSNAVKFTPKNGKINIYASVIDNTTVEISFKDSGIGMSSELINDLFHLDKKVSRKGTDGEPSTGLGLHLCKEFAEKLNGEIEVESIEGKGSIFKLFIPCTIDQNESILTQKNDLQEQVENNFKKLKVLIAEDDSSSEMTFAILIRSITRNTLIARTGTDAVKTCKENPDIDLILMDYRMPEMNGFEAVKKIREFNKKVVIFAQTAHTLNNERKLAFEVGCDDFIEKPVKKIELMSLIQKHFNN